MSNNKGNNRHIGKKRKNSAPSAPVLPVLGIDLGLAGAFVLFDGTKIEVFEMPTEKTGKHNEIVFHKVLGLLHSISVKHKNLHVFLERAVSFGMGSSGAFNYGRGFAALEIAIGTVNVPVTYVEPNKWTKAMHAGISKNLKPKVKSGVALRRLYPNLIKDLPKNTKGKLLDGPIDALLIAAYGHRSLGVMAKPVEVPDFY